MNGTMNIVDIVILGILALSVLVGLYRGFISSVASIGGTLLSLGLSFVLSPKLVSWVQSNPDLIQEAIDIIKELRDAWAQAMKKARQEDGSTRNAQGDSYVS